MHLASEAPHCKQFHPLLVNGGIRYLAEGGFR